MPRATSGTLTANVATANIKPDEGPTGINVVNRSGMEGRSTTPIWVSTTATPPTVAGSNCFPVYGARLFLGDELGTELRLISAAALDYTVEAA